MEEKKVLQELLAPLDSEHLMRLGNRNSKTPKQAYRLTGQATEIYTHVSTKNLQNIITPADIIFSDKGKINE